MKFNIVKVGILNEYIQLFMTQMSLNINIILSPLNFNIGATVRVTQEHVQASLVCDNLIFQVLYKIVI